MEYNVYVDSLFLLNFIMNLLVLCSVYWLLRWNTGKGRILMAALLGSTISCLLLFLSITITGIRFLIAAIMTMTAYKAIRGKQLFLSVCLVYLTAFSMEGIMRFTQSKWSVWLIPVICYAAGKQKKIMENEITVWLTFKGKTKKLKGFYDTGNRLLEPVTGRMVHITSYENVKELLPLPYQEVVEEYFKTGFLESTKVTKLQMYEFTFLSYHSIGKETGQLLGIRMDSAVFQGDAGKKTEEKTVIGLTNQKILLRNHCQMIINGRLEL